MYFQLEAETVRHKNAANPAGRRLSPPMSLACLCARCGEAKNALPAHRGNSAYGPLHYLRQAPVVSPTLARTPDLLATKVRPRIGQGGIVVTTILRSPGAVRHILGTRQHSQAAGPGFTCRSRIS